MFVSEAEYGYPETYVAKKELGPYTSDYIRENDLSPRMGTGVV
jgi:hypothetical protein